MSTKPQPNMLIKLFPLLGEKSVNLRTELLAGLTTFLTMAYIIAINPSILSEAGMDAGALVTGTCLAAALGCFLMGFIANCHSAWPAAWDSTHSSPTALCSLMTSHGRSR